MPSWQSTSRIGCLINNLARRSRGAISPTRLQWTRVPLDFRPRWRYVVNKAGAANAAPALKYKFYFTPHFCGYTEFGIVPYPWEYNTFILGGDVILIENDLLADALNALPQDNRDILLMYWFLEMADREIAERMNLARRTINNRRLKSYRLLKELMGGDTDA